MSFWLSKVRDEDPYAAPAGGEASLAAIAGAAYRSALYVDNTLAARKAQEDAVDERNAAIFADTGIAIDNPFRTNVRTPSDRPGRQFSGSQEVRLAQYEQRLQKLAEQYPDARDSIRAGTGVLAMGAETARKADAALAQQMESRSGIGKWAAVLAGSAGAMWNDPVQILSMGIGGELSAARSVWSAIGKTALKEALINGATETAMQPFVQDWRAKAGLDHGTQQALANILTASVIGGAFGALSGAAQAAVRPRLAGADLEAATAAARPKLKPEINKALDGDPAALAEALRPLRNDLPADVRGGMDAAEIDAHAASLKPARTALPDHEAAMRQAARMADPEAVHPLNAVDENRVSRLAALEYAGGAKGAAPKGKAHTLSEFIMAAGGMTDDGGELSALNLQGRGKAFFGSLVNPDGRNLDAMREAVAEAGYFTEKFGSIEEAMTRSTVNDLLDALDTDMRGTPVFSSIDMAEGRVSDSVRQTVTEARASAADHIHAVLAEGGPGLDDELVRAAAQLHAQGLSADAAIERAAIQLGDAKPRGKADGWRISDDIPGFEPVADGVDDVPQRLAAPEDYDMLTPEEVDALGDMEGFDEGTLHDAWGLAVTDEDIAALLDSCRLR